VLPSLSVVIPSHNRPDLLDVCLASVRRHAPAGTEVLVVDDASPSGAAAAVVRRFRDVRVVRRERRGGFAAAANAGVRAARHAVVETLNDDTEVTAGWAEAALGWFADAAVAAVAPLVLCPTEGKAEPPRIDSAGDRYFLGGVAGKRGHGERLGAEYQRCCPVFGASASSAFYRRDAFLAVGGFPEHFGAYFEDVDLSFRLHWAGWRILYEPASRVWHHTAASYGPPRHGLLEQQSRNEELVFWRNLPAAALVHALPLHLAVLAAKAWRRWREGNLLPFLRGKLRALSQMADVCRHRRSLPPAATADLAAWGVEARFWGSGGDRPLVKTWFQSPQSPERERRGQRPARRSRSGL
jgi:GT2 family glycosyltransferase